MLTVFLIEEDAKNTKTHHVHIGVDYFRGISTNLCRETGDCFEEILRNGFYNSKTCELFEFQTWHVVIMVTSLKVIYSTDQLQFKIKVVLFVGG